MQKSLIAVLTLGLLSTGALAQQMYQWTDERGVTQYGQLPPTGSHYRQIIVQPPPPPGGQLRAPAPLPLKPDTSARDAAAEQRRQLRAEAEQRSAACEKLRSNLDTLLNNPRLRRTTATGEVERIGEDERQLMISKAQESLRENCQNQS
ncbi:protein of unknown function [Halopseudomonas litoralis]|uniref:DUF4124 domain-containing protein n=1 Tax=Halopseudomonas litoralis TaxID=797277 RepID=A0A1H1L590_9GAMM|nr:DUF4124 domain-containing protein [Halopseudomonas litoralis]SDR69751.1 protein of unknown function [Halopseudomonas litoralis]